MSACDLWPKSTNIKRRPTLTIPPSAPHCACTNMTTTQHTPRQPLRSLRRPTRTAGCSRHETRRPYRPCARSKTTCQTVRRRPSRWTSTARTAAAMVGQAEPTAAHARPSGPSQGSSGSAPRVQNEWRETSNGSFSGLRRPPTDPTDPTDRTGPTQLSSRLWRPAACTRSQLRGPRHSVALRF